MTRPSAERRAHVLLTRSLSFWPLIGQSYSTRPLISWGPGAGLISRDSRLYKRVCPSVGRSVRPSVRRSVRPSVRNAFVKIAENGVMQDEGASRAVYPALFSKTFLYHSIPARREEKPFLRYSGTIIR